MGLGIFLGGDSNIFNHASVGLVHSNSGIINVFDPSSSGNCFVPSNSGRMPLLVFIPPTPSPPVSSTSRASALVEDISETVLCFFRK